MDLKLGLLAAREWHTLMVSENRVLMGTFEAKREETGG
jgi:hypothetical protein